ncbi:hypothetical protein G9A89_019196 [Geosiphon pyriformis]|nr:hypothetical protein G9A89_019196 [Geosiphon pyriformis]
MISSQNINENSTNGSTLIQSTSSGDNNFLIAKEQTKFDLNSVENTQEKNHQEGSAPPTASMVEAKNVSNLKNTQQLHIPTVPILPQIVAPENALILPRSQNNGSFVPIQPYPVNLLKEGISQPLASTQPTFALLPTGTTIPQPIPVNRPKRQQVKNACVNCQKACKKCDDQRPCSRCIKYELTETCKDSSRKERKRGIKRGPYKKKESKKVKAIPAQTAPAENIRAQNVSSSGLIFTSGQPASFGTLPFTIFGMPSSQSGQLIMIPTPSTNSGITPYVLLPSHYLPQGISINEEQRLDPTQKEEISSPNEQHEGKALHSPESSPVADTKGKSTTTESTGSKLTLLSQVCSDMLGGKSNTDQGKKTTPSPSPTISGHHPSNLQDPENLPIAVAPDFPSHKIESSVSSSKSENEIDNIVINSTAAEQHPQSVEVLANQNSTQYNKITTERGQIISSAQQQTNHLPLKRAPPEADGDQTCANKRIRSVSESFCHIPNGVQPHFGPLTQHQFQVQRRINSFIPFSTQIHPSYQQSARESEKISAFIDPSLRQNSSSFIYQTSSQINSQASNMQYGIPSHAPNGYHQSQQHISQSSSQQIHTIGYPNFQPMLSTQGIQSLPQLVQSMHMHRESQNF